AGEAGSAVTNAVTTTAVPISPSADLPLEDIYLDTLDTGGIVYSTGQAAIDTGNAICDYLASGGSFAGAVSILAQHGGYSGGDAGYIIGAAQGSLCLAGAL
ncbi:DUF732 domain-containing protein, partial [Actinophytocola sediminis]